MAFKFEKLRIWQSARENSNNIHLIVKNFPKDELFSLSSQIRRAANSIALNIAEGSTGQSDKELKRFLNYAIRSGIEVVSCLYLAKDRGYLEDEIFK